MLNLILNFFLIIFIAFGGVCLGLFFKGIDRILSAKMQKRVGPPIFQPFYDLRKLMVKESIIPKNASKRIFEIALSKNISCRSTSKERSFILASSSFVIAYSQQSICEQIIQVLK
jgi:formate hydrogenlyase subunit 4